jgi:hypothetical protein
VNINCEHIPDEVDLLEIDAACTFDPMESWDECLRNTVPVIYRNLCKLLDDAYELHEPARAETVTEYAERNVFIPDGAGPLPGQYRSIWTPYIREWLECARDGTQSIALMTAVQVSKTLFLQIFLSYVLDTRTDGAIWTFPSKEYAYSFSKSKWIPFIEKHRTLGKKLTQPLSEKIIGKSVNPSSIIEQLFLTSWLNFVWSNSVTQLSGRTVKYVLKDEVDKYAQGAKTQDEANKRSRSTAKNAQAAATLLADDRNVTYDSSITIDTSSPTTTKGEINVKFEAGTQEYFNVQCHACGVNNVLFFEPENRIVKRNGKDVMRYKSVKWDVNAFDKDKGKWNLDLVRESARGVCTNQDCRAEWTDQQRIEAVRSPNARWIATNPNASKKDRSFQLSALYAPWKKYYYGALAVEYLKRKDQPTGMRHFQTSRNGEPYDDEITEQVESSQVQDVITKSPKYRFNITNEQSADNQKRGRVIETRNTVDVLPIRPFQLWLTADVQKFGIYYVIRAYNALEESYLVEYGCITTWIQLIHILKREFTYVHRKDPELGLDDSNLIFGKDGKPIIEQYRITPALVDSRYLQQDVYDFCCRCYGTVWPSEGRGPILHSPIRTMSRLFNHKGYDMEVVQYVDALFKKELYHEKIQQRKIPGWYLPQNCPNDYVLQLMNEHYLPVLGGSGEWKRTGACEYADAEKLHRVLLDKLRYKFVSERQRLGLPDVGVVNADLQDPALALINMLKMASKESKQIAEHITRVANDPRALAALSENLKKLSNTKL